MHFTPVELVRLALVVAVEGTVCVLAWWRGLYHRLPVFTAYLSAVVLGDLLRFATIVTLGPRSKQEFIMYWSTELVMVLLRAGVVYELCAELLRGYPGVWRLCLVALCLAAFTLAAVPLFGAIHQGPWIARLFLTIERVMELEVLGVLVVVASFCRYYQVPVDRLIALIIVGLSLYSAIAIVNDTLASYWFDALRRVWAEVRANSFLVTEIIWMIALWKPLERHQGFPVLLDSGVYSRITPVLSFRLRQLNERLEEIWR